METMQDGDAQEGPVTAALVVIGDEILSGRTKDENIGYLAEHLTAIGIVLREVRVVGDEEEEIVAAVNALRACHDYVFTTGGIGPTHDDITADAIAKAFGVGIDFDARAVAMLEQHYRDKEFTEARRKMARIPFGAELIDNPVSTAPGFWIENVLVMAGIPRIMQVMLDAVTPKLKKGRIMHSATLKVEKPESAVALVLARHQEAFRDVSMGSYPFYQEGRFGTHLVLRSIDEARLREAEGTLRARLAEDGIGNVAPAEFSC